MINATSSWSLFSNATTRSSRHPSKWQWSNKNVKQAAHYLSQLVQTCRSALPACSRRYWKNLSEAVYFLLLDRRRRWCFKIQARTIYPGSQRNSNHTNWRLLGSIVKALSFYNLLSSGQFPVGSERDRSVDAARWARAIIGSESGLAALVAASCSFSKHVCKSRLGLARALKLSSQPRRTDRIDSLTSAWAHKSFRGVKGV